MYSADNADVNICTIDRKNTLHVMGMIRSTISRGKPSNKVIERKFPTAERATYESASNILNEETRKERC